VSVHNPKEYSPVVRRVRFAFAAAALIPLALAAAGCSSSSSTPPSSTTSSSVYKGPALPASPAKAPASITETGSTLLYPLFGSWATAYQKLFKQVTITDGGTGSGTGIADASTGTVNLGGSDAYLSSSDRTTYPSMMNIAVAISAQQVNVNIPNVKSIKLDGTVLAQIYSGKITNWDDSAIAALNPGVTLPSLKIVPLHRADSSGDTFLFTTYMNDQDPSVWSSADVGTSVSWPSVPGALAETGNSGMVAGCAATKGCVAYIGISYLSKTTADGLGQAMLKNASGSFEAPSATTIGAEASSFISKTPANETISLINGPAANGYPIVNYEYLVVNSKQSTATISQDLRALLYWEVTAGQSEPTYLSAVNFQPLPASVVTLSENQIKKIG
jgi:phosphate transport system substrate-binding protein